MAAALDRYTLVEQLGRGGMAEVWRGRLRREAGFSREVAIKVMRPEWGAEPDFVSMFIDEACLSARLSHPNIVATLDYGCEAGCHFLAMELVEGVTLRVLLRHAPAHRLDAALAARVIAEVAAALDYAHQALGDDGRPLRIVHRDVNPSNVMVSARGEVKLADFGIAWAASRQTATEAGMLKGKFGYMSPEQAAGRELDGRSDVYALGLTLFEAAMGRRALGGGVDLQVLQRAQAAEVEPIDDGLLGQPLAATLRRALAARCEERFPTAGALRQALAEVTGVAREQGRDLAAELVALVAEARRLEPAPSAAPRETPNAGTGASTVASSPRARRRAGAVLVAAAAIGAAGLTGGAALLATRGGQREPSTARAAASSASVTPAPASPATVASPSPSPTPPPPQPPAPDRTVALAPRPAPPAAARRPATSRNVPTPAVAPESDHATLRIRVEPWGVVTLDDRAVGTTPLKPIAVTAGEHLIVVENPDLGRRGERRVTVAAGESRLVEVDLSR